MTTDQPDKPPLNEPTLEKLIDAIGSARALPPWQRFGTVSNSILLLILMVLPALLWFAFLDRNHEDPRPWTISCYSSAGTIAFVTTGVNPQVVLGGLTWESATEGGTEGKYAGICSATRTATP